MKLFAAAAALIATATGSAHAAPVYLKCQLDADVGKRGPGSVTLNEDTSMVSYSFPDIDRVFTVRGFFTSDKVTYNGFTIDRSTLSYTRDMGEFAAPGATPQLDHGKCTIEQAKRAF